MKLLGRDKAIKFSHVERLTLNQISLEMFAHFERQGLKGDALRSAIKRKFVESETDAAIANDFLK